MNLLTEFTKLREQEATLHTYVKQLGEAALLEAAKEVFNAVEGLNKFVVLGYTPSWNDGEPCEHTHVAGFGDYHVSVSHYRDCKYLNGDAISDYEKYEDFLELQDGWEDASEVDYVNKLVVRDEALKFDKVVWLVKVVAEILYGTDYELLFTLKEDGSVALEYNDYDCGY